MAKQAIICQGCGIEAPVKYVEFYQNIGMVVMRQHRSVKGNLCKRCIHGHFWKLTSVTVAIGWLGTISVIIAPIFVINNITRYLIALGMPGVPRGATRPVLTEAAVAAIDPHRDALIQRINGGGEINAVARDIAASAGVTPGQVLLYVQALARQTPQPQPVQKTYGFPVQPPAAAPVRAIPLE